MILNVVALIIIAGLMGVVFIQSYSIKTLSDSLESYAYTCNRLAHENAELRKLLHK